MKKNQENDDQTNQDGGYLQGRGGALCLGRGRGWENLLKSCKYSRLLPGWELLGCLL